LTGDLPMNRSTIPTTTLILAALAVCLSALPVSAQRSKKGVKVVIDDLSSRTPSGWQEVSKVRPPRYKHFILPRAKGDKRDAELTLFYFNGGGGSAAANIARWKTLFVPPEGKHIDDVTTIKRFKVSGVRLTTVDIRGTYLYRKRPSEPLKSAQRRPDHRMITGLFETENGPYFFRLVGPEKTVARHAKKFTAWLKAFK
ncbi:MAG: hypothetical protein AAGC55_27990, partial [Myxococcota bacterium]